MENEHLIPLEQFCTHYHVEVSFMQALTEFGLVEITTIETIPCIHKEHIRSIEQLIHLHYELGINIEGLDAIRNLLQKVDTMQSEITGLKNRLRFYEPE
jgi:hypothetical protein